MVFLWFSYGFPMNPGNLTAEIFHGDFGQRLGWVSALNLDFFIVFIIFFPYCSDAYTRFCPFLPPSDAKNTQEEFSAAVDRFDSFDHPIETRCTRSRPRNGEDHPMTIPPPKKVISVPWKHHWLVVYLPLWKIMELKSVGMIIPNILKNEKCSKPPTRLTLNLKDEPQGALSRRISRRMCWNFEPQLAQTRVWYTHLFHNMANPTINLY